MESIFWRTEQGIREWNRLHRKGRGVEAIKVSIHSSVHRCDMDITVTEKHTEDDPIEFAYSGRTEEGHKTIIEKFWMNDRGVVCNILHEDETDCDGRFENTYIYQWIDSSWEHVESSQRDHRAESMGY